MPCVAAGLSNELWSMANENVFIGRIDISSIVSTDRATLRAERWSVKGHVVPSSGYAMNPWRALADRSRINTPWWIRGVPQTRSKNKWIHLTDMSLTSAV